MKMLIITPTPPTLPASDGVALIAAHLLTYLKPRHDVTCLTTTDFQYARSLWQHYLFGHSRHQPWYTKNYTAPQISEYLKQHETNFDLIYLHSELSLGYLPAITHTPIVVGLIDTMSAWYQQTAAATPNWFKKIHFQHEAKASARLEQELGTTLIKAVIVVTAEDKANLLLPNKTKVHVIPNGVDLTEFTPATTPPAQPAIMFTGMLDYAPNVDAVLYFYRTIWPQVRQPNLRWYIVGRRPTPAIVRLAKHDQSIIVTGAVSSMPEYLHKATVYIAPIRFGAGIKNKLLEALACGLPIVALESATTGLAAAPIVVSTAEDFANQITALLKDQARRQALGQAGRSYVETHHNWTTLAAHYEHIICTQS